MTMAQLALLADADPARGEPKAAPPTDQGTVADLVAWHAMAG